MRYLYHRGKLKYYIKNCYFCQITIPGKTHKKQQQQQRTTKIQDSFKKDNLLITTSNPETGTGLQSSLTLRVTISSPDHPPLN